MPSARKSRRAPAASRRRSSTSKRSRNSNKKSATRRRRRGGSSSRVIVGHRVQLPVVAFLQEHIYDVPDDVLHARVAAVGLAEYFDTATDALDVDIPDPVTLKNLIAHEILSKASLDRRDKVTPLNKVLEILHEDEDLGHIVLNLPNPRNDDDNEDDIVTGGGMMVTMSEWSEKAKRDIASSAEAANQYLEDIKNRGTRMIGEYTGGIGGSKARRTRRTRRRRT